MIAASTEVERSAEATYAYATDPARFPEWQDHVEGGELEHPGGPAVGDLCTSVRRIGFASRPIASRITELDPPRRWAIEGIEGPIRADVAVTVEPLGVRRSRLRIEIDFSGHGLGRLLVPLAVRPGAPAEMERNLARLKRNLEGEPGAR